MRICTIVAENYLPQARVLAASYAAHNAGAPCSVLLIDDPEHLIDGEQEPFELLRPENLGITRFEAMAAMFDVTELATAIKPLLLRYLLNREAEPVAYFDPDIQFFADIDEIAALAAREQVVLIPHVALEPVPRDGRQPSEMDLLASGTYNLGFIALAPGPSAQRLLDWWWERLKFDCVIDHAMGFFVDQRWFDLVGSVVASFHVLRDPGVNVAYWNLHERRLSRKDGRYEVNGQPLRFFHFSGFDPTRPHLLSKHQTRVRLTELPTVSELCFGYAEAVVERGFESLRQPWRYSRLADGTELAPVLRELYRDGERDGAFRHSPFTAEGTTEFIAWLQEPAKVGAQYGLTRICMVMYGRRPDLRAAFPDLQGRDGERFMDWVHRHAADDFKIPPCVLPPTADEAPEQLEAAGAAEPWGVNVAGYLSSVLGVGEAGRAVITALDTANVPVMPIHGSWVPKNRQGHAFVHLDTEAAPFPVNLICVNADQLPNFVASAGSEFAADRYTIGFWWWEVSKIPDGWDAAFDLVDELWVGSEHVADAFRLVSDVPVVKVRIPVMMPPIVPYARAELGLPEGYLFTFAFDFHSVFDRKNPLAVLEAFRRAFAPGEGASLVLKCINGSSDPDNFDRLQLAAAEHPDIHVIDRYVSAAEKNAMIDSCDCYVSLHRSEGFGLTLAEAMYLGKPVIGTRYSGNLDFMTDANSYLVACAMRPVGKGRLPYPADGEWAEPDVEQAAVFMREVFEQPDAARERGRQAASDLRRTHSPQAAGKVMAKRLDRVRARLIEAARAEAGVPNVNEPLANAEALVRQGPFQNEHDRSAVRAKLRRVVIRLASPATAHLQQSDWALLAAIRDLRQQLRQYRAAPGTEMASLLAELRRQDRAVDTLRSEVERLRVELRQSRDTNGSGESSPQTIQSPS